MKEHLYGDALVLSILEKELAAATKKAAKAKADCEATITAPSGIIQVRAEAHELIKDGMRDMPKEKIAKLNTLAEKERKLIEVAKRSLNKLMDAECEADSLVNELQRIVFQLKRRVQMQRGSAA